MDNSREEWKVAGRIRVEKNGRLQDGYKKVERRMEGCRTDKKS